MEFEETETPFTRTYIISLRYKAQCPLNINYDQNFYLETNLYFNVSQTSYCHIIFDINNRNVNLEQQKMHETI